MDLGANTIGGAFAGGLANAAAKLGFQGFGSAVVLGTGIALTQDALSRAVKEKVNPKTNNNKSPRTGTLPKSPGRPFSHPLDQGFGRRGPGFFGMQANPPPAADVILGVEGPAQAAKAATAASRSSKSNPGRSNKTEAALGKADIGGTTDTTGEVASDNSDTDDNDDNF